MEQSVSVALVPRFPTGNIVRHSPVLSEVKSKDTYGELDFLPGLPQETESLLIFALCCKVPRGLRLSFVRYEVLSGSLSVPSCIEAGCQQVHDLHFQDH